MDEEDDGGSAQALGTEIRILRARRMLRTLGLVQDLAGGGWQAGALQGAPLLHSVLARCPQHLLAACPS